MFYLLKQLFYFIFFSFSCFRLSLIILSGLLRHLLNVIYFHYDKIIGHWLVHLYWWLLFILFVINICFIYLFIRLLFL
jgi:hypothetical protein